MSAINNQFWMAGVFAPVTEEVTELDLPVTGHIPTELQGRYFRNGPNPRLGSSMDWFLGEGMIHGIEISGGKVNWYRNRYVRTPLLEQDELTLDLIASPGNSLANTHVMNHAGKILALQEMHPPVEVTRDLETVGTYSFGGKLAGNMTAHPKICPVTGEMMFFGYGLAPPFLTYHRVSAAGDLVQSEEIDVRAATMVHDFAITRDHVLFMDLPMLWNFEQLAESGIPVKFDESYGARLGVMPRHGSGHEIRWFEIDPCYIYHTMNAHEEEGEIVLRAPRLTGYTQVGMGHPPVPRLHEWRLNLETCAVTELELDDLGIDFPSVPPSLTGLPSRYGYCAQLETEGIPHVLGFHKYDIQSGSSTSFVLPPGWVGSEPTFIPSDNAVAEDDGYLVSYLHSRAGGNSEFVILDARQLDDEPVARIRLPVRVPAGFHGSWIPDTG